MSTTVMAICWPLKMPPTPKAVLISLADNANDQGYCWPSISTISERTCFSKRAVIDAIAWLESAGLLTADRANGRHTTYIVSPSNYIEPVQQAHQCGKSTSAAAASKPVQQAHQPVHLPHQPVQQLHTNHQEPSLTVKSNHQSKRDSRFAEFWGAYPIKVGRKQCLAKWNSLGLDDLAETILDDIAAKRSKDRRWIAGYVPNPQTYINQERWLDPVQPVQRQSAQTQSLGPTSKAGQAIMKLQGIIDGNKLDRDRDSERLTGASLLELGSPAG